MFSYGVLNSSTHINYGYVFEDKGILDAKRNWKSNAALISRNYFVFASTFDEHIFFSQVSRSCKPSLFQLFSILDLHFEIDACWKSGYKIVTN